MNMKRFLSFLLVLCMIGGMLPGAAFAEEVPSEAESVVVDSIPSEVIPEEEIIEEEIIEEIIEEPEQTEPESILNSEANLEEIPTQMEEETPGEITEEPIREDSGDENDGEEPEPVTAEELPAAGEESESGEEISGEEVLNDEISEEELPEEEIPVEETPDDQLTKDEETDVGEEAETEEYTVEFAFLPAEAVADETFLFVIKDGEDEETALECGEIKETDAETGKITVTGLIFGEEYYYSCSCAGYEPLEKEKFTAGDEEITVVFTNYTANAEELFSDAPEKNSISATVAKNEGNGEIVFELTMDITEATAENGFHYGVFFSTDRASVERAECEDIWHDDIDEAGFGITRLCSTQRFLPGNLYYYRAFIRDHDFNIICADEIREVTANEEQSAIPALEFNRSVDLYGGCDRAFTFTAETAGLYSLIVEGESHETVYNADGYWLAGSDCNEPDGRSVATFAAYEGEKVYVYANYHTGDDQYTKLIITDPQCKSIGIGEEAIHSDEVVCFTAPEDGFYTLSLRNMEAGFSMLDFDEGNPWLYSWSGSFSMSFSAGKTRFFRAQYDEYQSGTNYISISKFDPPEDDAITSSILKNDGNGEVIFAINYEITPETASAGYRYGILFSQDQKSLESGNCDRNWEESFSIVNDGYYEYSICRFLPGVHYYYAAYISDREDAILLSDEVREFTANASETDITVLKLNETGKLYGGSEKPMTFTAGANGVYSVVIKGESHCNVSYPNGNFISWADCNEPDGETVATFALRTGEKIFVFAGYHRGGDEYTDITVVNGGCRALQRGEALSVRDREIVYFTAPEEAFYQFKAVDVEDYGFEMLNYSAAGEPWEGAGRAGFAIYLEEGETKYFRALYDECRFEASILADVMENFAHVTDETGLREAALAAAEKGTQEAPYVISIDAPVTVNGSPSSGQ